MPFTRSMACASVPLNIGVCVLVDAQVQARLGLWCRVGGVRGVVVCSVGVVVWAQHPCEKIHGTILKLRCWWVRSANASWPTRFRNVQCAT